jgi:hypothetical protein
MGALGFARHTLRLGEAERDEFVERSLSESTSTKVTFIAV